MSVRRVLTKPASAGFSSRSVMSVVRAEDDGGSRRTEGAGASVGALAPEPGLSGAGRGRQSSPDADRWCLRDGVAVMAWESHDGRVQLLHGDALALHALWLDAQVRKDVLDEHVRVRYLRRLLKVREAQAAERLACAPGAAVRGLSQFQQVSGAR